jgi:hypothetical protein
MTKKSPIVLVGHVSAEQLNDPHPEDPAVGKWYWLRLKDGEHLACVVRVGSNFLEMRTVNESARRVHVDKFFKNCRHEPNPEAVIDREVRGYDAHIRALMEEIRSVTMRLGVGESAALPGRGEPSETRALAVIGRSEPIDGYKKALVKAKKETLPELFKKVERAHEGLATWMTARLIPMKAQSGSLEESIEKIENRIFSVELYAGLSEKVKQVKDGEPAAMTEPVHLMQRRAYMDEECLAQYEVGGMDFRDLDQFDRWLMRPSNLDRLLPHPRCVVAFRVRGERKAREYDEDEYGGIFEYVHFVLQMEEADKLTFLYIRNGDQLFRLSTKIEFGPKLFPDVNRQLLNAGRKLWAKDDRDGWKVLTEDEYLAIKEEEETRIAEDQKKYDEWKERVAEMTPAQRREESHFGPHVHTWWDRDKYHPYNQDSVYYDDITKAIRAELEQHNRLVLVLQGLLDRSPVLHPHPPWSLWNADSFAQALVLHYDDDRALTTGAAPDFAAYRDRLNASIGPGSITVGQQAIWRAIEREKERESERSRRMRRSRGEGPGKLAHVVAVSHRSKAITYKWTRKRQKWGMDDDSDSREIGCAFTTKIRNVLNVSAYKPGDFKTFFADPRTRADYLQWAPLLLEAEEYHAGNREVTACRVAPPRQKTEEGARAYARRKKLKALVGVAVKLVRDVTMRSGHVYKKGTLWRVDRIERGELVIYGIKPNGERDVEDRHIYRISEYSFERVDGIPNEKEENES